MYWLLMLSLIMYYFRYTIFYYYCKLYTFIEKLKTIKPIEKNNIVFDTETYKIYESDKIEFNDDDKNIFKLNLIDSEKDNKLYQIYPNNNTEPTDKRFIFCEISYNNKTYEITSFLKDFYLKDNIILNRIFITYILFKYFNIKVKQTDKYSIIFIDGDMKNIKINDDINTFKYIL